MRRAAMIVVLVMTFALVGCGNGTNNGTAASATAERVAVASTTTAQATAPLPAPSPGAQTLLPDPAVGLDTYTSISDLHTLAVVAMAFSALPLSDDQKLSLLPATPGAADAFAKRDLLAKNLPQINAQLDAVRTQRYYRLNVAPPPTRPDPAVKMVTWSGRELLADAYDFGKKGFPIACLSTTTLITNRTPKENYFETVDFQSVKPVFAGTMMHGAMCLLPVPDESIAKTIEAARVKANGHLFTGNSSLYFFVVNAIPGGWPSSIHAVLTHVDVSIIDPAAHASAAVLATVSFDL